MTRSYKHATKINNSGFTLIEITMVMLIIVLLMTGLLPTITSQIDLQRTTETRKLLRDIQEALIGYTLIYGRLPCPADPTIATGATNAGLERPSCTVAADSTGVVPWATLGTSEIDGWGNRLSYRVTSNFADSSDGTGAACAIATGVSFQLCSIGSLTVNSSATTGTNIAIGIPAVIISHGANGSGGYSQQGTTLPGSADLDEQENYDDEADSIYVIHTPTTSFDDMVVWITPNILYNRMVMAGKLP